MEKKDFKAFPWQLKQEGGLSNSFAIYRLKTSDLYDPIVLHFLASTRKCHVIFSVQLEAKTGRFCILRYSQFNFFEGIKFRRGEAEPESQKFWTIKIHL